MASEEKAGELSAQSVQKDVGGRPKEWTEELIEVERIALEKWIANPKNYYFTSFLNDRRLGLEQIRRFARENERFCDTFTLAQRMQEQRLVDLAVTRKGDPGFIKFVLQNKAGWRERNEISGDPVNPLTILMDQIGKQSSEVINIEPIDTKQIE